ncbi:OmpA family protein [Marinobacter flavimaris]|nr:OmpA family protein [Marinobacter flavimaris]
MFLRVLFLLTFSLFAPLVIAEEPDHPLLTRYPGAEIDEWLYTEYEKVDLPTGPLDAGGNLHIDTLVGDLTRIVYEIESVSTLKVFENYRGALKESGAQLVSVCELDECGDKDSGLHELAASVAGVSYFGSNFYRKPYFLRASLSGAQGMVHVGLFVGGFDGDVRVQQVVVEEVPRQNTLISVSEEYLSRAHKDAATGDQRTAEEKKQDHPMMARYPGARLYRSRTVEYEKMSLPLTVLNSEGVASENLDLTGDITQHSYQIENVSTLKVFQNYLEAIEKLGFTLEYACEKAECGGDDASEALGERLAVTGDVENYFRDPHYLIASREVAEGRVVVGIYAGGFEGEVWLQQVVIEETGTENDLIEVNADQLYQEIERSGKALVYGIYFDTDSAEVKENSAEALEAISELMTSHPELDLYVVGHTDDTGESDYNLSLSGRRAASVAEVLTAQYSVESGRLAAAGVGPYAPVAGNESKEGKRLNRRVELVRRL